MLYVHMEFMQLHTQNIFTGHNDVLALPRFCANILVVAVITILVVKTKFGLCR